jgi:hypothetical protein
MSRISDQDRSELRRLFSQLADIHADGIIEELEEQPAQACALKQDLWAIEARLTDVRADYIASQWALLTDD